MDEKEETSPSTDVRVVQGATLRPLYVRMRGFESHFVHFFFLFLTKQILQ